MENYTKFHYVYGNFVLHNSKVSSISQAKRSTFNFRTKQANSNDKIAL